MKDISDDRSTVLKSPRHILKLKNPPEELILEALSRDGLLIEHFKNPTVMMQMTAYRNTPEAAMHIDNPCPAILNNLVCDWRFQRKDDSIGQPREIPVAKGRGEVAVPSRMSSSNFRFIA